jgi:uncharacterized protein (DUF433 family)
VVVARRTAQPARERIVRNPGILGGEPTVAGTRVPVRSIVVSHRRYGGDVAQVAEAFAVERSAVQAALRFYEQHRVEIDELIHQNEAAANSADA